MKIPPEDLTHKQLLDAYKELDAAHEKFKAESDEKMAKFKSAEANKIAALEAKYMAAEEQAAQKYAALKAEHEQFKALHLKHPAVVVADFDYDQSLGLYKLKRHPERGYFCGYCVPQGTAAQMRKGNHSLVCNVCGRG